MHDVLIDVVASATAGCTATMLGHPLDCVKVQLQALRQLLCVTR